MQGVSHMNARTREPDRGRIDQPPHELTAVKWPGRPGNTVARQAENYTGLGDGQGAQVPKPSKLSGRKPGRRMMDLR